jgi:hypothetical protein
LYHRQSLSSSPNRSQLLKQWILFKRVRKTDCPNIDPKRLQSMAGKIYSQRVIQQEDDFSLPCATRQARATVPPLSPREIHEDPVTDPTSSCSATPRGRRTTSFFLYPSPPASPAVTRRLVSPPPPVASTASSSPSPSSAKSLSPTHSPLLAPRPIDRRRSNSTHLVGNDDADGMAGSLPNRLIPPLPPPRRRRSSPHVGKVSNVSR